MLIEVARTEIPSLVQPAVLPSETLEIRGDCTAALSATHPRKPLLLACWLLCADAILPKFGLNPVCIVTRLSRYEDVKAM